MTTLDELSQKLAESKKKVRFGLVVAARLATLTFATTTMLAKTTWWKATVADKEERSVRTADLLSCSLDRVGGLLKKVGQHLASRPDLVGKHVSGGLRRLQQEASPETVCEWAVMKRVLEEELESDVERVFATFDTDPVAAGCVAQVYSATLLDGTRVAVKVRVPGAKRKFEADAYLLGRGFAFARWVGELLSLRYPWEEAEGVLEQFGTGLVAQTNLMIEATNLIRFAANLRKRERTSAPLPFPSLCSERVVVMEWVDGEPLGSAGTPEEREEHLDWYLTAVKDMILRDGFLHGDLHPGNVLVGKDGKLHILDAGIVCELSHDMRSNAFVSATAYLRKDWDVCAKVMYSSSPSKEHDDEATGKFKQDRFARLLKELDAAPWKGVVDYWNRLMAAHAESEIRTDPAFDGVGVAILCAESLAGGLPEGRASFSKQVQLFRQSPPNSPSAYADEFGAPIAQQ